MIFAKGSENSFCGVCWQACSAKAISPHHSGGAENIAFSQFSKWNPYFLTLLQILRTFVHICYFCMASFCWTITSRNCILQIHTELTLILDRLVGIGLLVVYWRQEIAPTHLYWSSFLFFGKVRQTYSMLKITVLWKRVTLWKGNSSFFFFSWVLA